jgi:uncharacterized protein (UPF0261 family)
MDSAGILIVATMDTKGTEARFLEACFKESGLLVFILDGGIMGESSFPVTVTREDVALAGGMALPEIRNLGDEGKAMAVMIKGAAECAKRLEREGKIRGIIAIGGSMGTSLGTGVMRAFPLGFPKVMISTMASGNTRPFVRTKDILMLHSVCDLAGINRITAKILRNGALALAGMVKGAVPFAPPHRPLIVLSSLGTTEACAQRVRKTLEDRGKEVVLFHTVGSGGRAMEEMIGEQDVEAVLDLSLHELIDHHYGGEYDAGPDRGGAALQKGVPTILAPGNIDFLVTGPLAGAQSKFPGRPYHVHNAAITTIRTRKREVETIAGILVRICNEAKGPFSFMVPMGGFSLWDTKGGPFYDPDAVNVFTKAMKEGLVRRDQLQMLPLHINDPEFADAVVSTLERLLDEKGPY